MSCGFIDCKRYEQNFIVYYILSFSINMNRHCKKASAFFIQLFVFFFILQNKHSSLYLHVYARRINSLTITCISIQSSQILHDQFYLITCLIFVKTGDIYSGTQPYMDNIIKHVTIFVSNRFSIPLNESQSTTVNYVFTIFT